MRGLRVAFIPGFVLMALASFSAQNFWAAHSQPAEQEYWNKEIALATTGREPVGRFIDETLGHVGRKADWQMIDDKLVVKAPTTLKDSQIVIHVAVDCQARVIGGSAEIEPQSL